MRRGDLNDFDLAEALADALAAAERTLRERITRSARQPTKSSPSSIVEVARTKPPPLGPRQAQALTDLNAAGQTGLSTGQLARSMKYDQANVYLTLQSLIALGFAEK